MFRRFTHIPYWLISLSIVFVFTLPELMKDGMFQDAMLYVSVGRNLSMGNGSFWFPNFDDFNVIGIPSFHEQPPLVFGLIALAFKVFGDTMYTERIYTFIIILLTVFLINMFWRTVYNTEKDKQDLGWIAPVFWILIPVCYWSYFNAMNENTMCVFTLAASLIIFIAISKTDSNYLLLGLAGFLIVLAFLSKGFPGFFPVSVPFIYWLVYRESSLGKSVLQTLVLLLTIAVCAFALYLYPESRQSLEIYLMKRAFVRIANDPTVSSRFDILFRMFTEHLIQIILVVALLLYLKVKKRTALLFENKKEFLFFLLVGFAASLPLMLTKVQRGFYMVPAFPFTAMAFASLFAPFVAERLSDRTTPNSLVRVFSVLLFMGVIGYSLMQKGKYGRDKELLSDIHIIGKSIPHFIKVGTDDNTYFDWAMHNYLMRYYNVGVYLYKEQDFVLTKNSVAIAPSGYKKLSLPTRTLFVFKKIDGK